MLAIVDGILATGNCLRNAAWMAFSGGSVRPFFSPDVVRIASTGVGDVRHVFTHNIKED